MKPRSLREMKDEIINEINKPIPEDRIMSDEYDIWIEQQIKIKQKER
jgi:hypothetical protein